MVQSQARTLTDDVSGKAQTGGTAALQLAGR